MAAHLAEPESYLEDIAEFERLKTLTDRETVWKLIDDTLAKLRANHKKAEEKLAERIKADEVAKKKEEERKRRMEELKEAGVKIRDPIAVTKPIAQTIYITTNYGWGEGTSTVSIYLNIKNTEEILPDQYVLNVQEKSVNLDIKEHDGANYNFKLSPFHAEVIPDKTKIKFKKDQVVLVFKKKENKEWKELKFRTTRELYNDLTRAEESGKPLPDISPPRGEMNEMMKKMYEDADPETKQFMNKTWHESRNKGGMPGIPGMGGMDPFGMMGGFGHGHDHANGDGGHGHGH